MCRFIESIKLLDGQFYRLAFHQTRVNGVFAQFFQSNEPIDLATLLDKEDYPKNGIFKCRIVFDNSVQLIEFVPYTRREIKSLKIIETHIESTNYKAEERNKINEAFANRGDCDDIIMLNNGFLSDASYSNIALWDGENWHTPHIPVIYGTQRAALLQSGKIVERPIRKQDLSTYKRIRLFNALIEFGEIELDSKLIF